MQVRDWFRPPRHLLTVFMAVALASAAALGWLGWLLLEQDKALDAQRQQDRIEQAADRVAAAMQRSLADLQSSVGRPLAKGESFPPGLLPFTLDRDGRVIGDDLRLLYVPVRRILPEAPATTFAEGERLEFVSRDLDGAKRVYAALSAARDDAIRAGALARLARVRRKQSDPVGALGYYDLLARIEHVEVSDLPASLVARVGRASALKETGRTSDLHEEADSLRKDLRRARWGLLRSEYEFYAGQAADWLKEAPLPDADALVRAEAVGWLSENRSAVGSSGRRLIHVPSGHALLAWSVAPDRLHAVVAGPTYLAALSQSIGSDLRLALTDQDGRLIVGESPPARQAIVRSSAAGLPWSLHVFAWSGIAPPAWSSRRQLLMLAFVVVALVLMAGWYFILRAMSREMRVSRLQSDFVAAVSHEFRSPLTSMSHIAEMLAGDRFGSDDLRRTSYDVLVRETDRLRRLVEGLLEFGRFEAGAATLRIEPADLSELVRTTVADFQARVAPEGYAVECAMGNGRAVVHADREALSRALWNLLDNAVKYSPECHTVWVALESCSDLVCIVVRDRGIGIPVREQGQVFERFVRGQDSKARRIKGTGIGLAMVRQIVRAHGGEVTLESAPGAGSTFTVRLPLQVSGGKLRGQLLGDGRQAPPSGHPQSAIAEAGGLKPGA